MISKKEKGSTFWFEIPLETDEACTELPLGQQTLPEAKILLVDDTDINLDILEEQCRSWNLSPTRASGGEMAIALLEEAAAAGEPFDAVLLDYHMPDVDGMAVAGHIHQNPSLSRVKIVVLSSADDDSSITAFRNLGANGYLVKPVRSALLYKSLAQALAQPVPAPANKEMPAAPPETCDSEDQRWRILVAEDNEVNRMVVASYLSEDPCDLVFAEDGRAAVEAFETATFDLILMDLSMPRLDGLDATAEIRAIEERKGLDRTPIICVTAHALTESRAKVEASGMDDFLTKPIKKHALKVAVHQWAGAAAELRKVG